MMFWASPLVVLSKTSLRFYAGYVKRKGWQSLKAALLTKGMKDMLVLGKALGAREDTLTGLAGLGI